MTDAAKKFISPLTFQALSGNPVHDALLDSDQENAMGHIRLARWADVLLIAPATAHCIAKISHGLADDLLSTLYLAATCPVYIAPAMNQAMWNKAVVQENIARIKAQGVTIIGPDQGDQACGETGLGRMTEAEEIFRQIAPLFPARKTEEALLKGLKIMISAGPTREPLDPVRYITNRSSGKMGYALAQAAIDAGAEVTLVSGPVALTAPAKATTIGVETAAQMHQAVMNHISGQDIYIGAAAVADYGPAVRHPQKIKKLLEQTTLTLSKNKDILADVAALKKRPFTVGFAAETENLEANAQTKLAQKNLDMIAANWVGQQEGGFDRQQNALEIFWKNGRKTLKMADKTQLAEQLLAVIATRFGQHNH